MFATTFSGAHSITGDKSPERRSRIRASRAPTARYIIAQGKRVIERRPGSRQQPFPAARSVSASAVSFRACRRYLHSDSAGRRDSFFIHPGLRRYRFLPWAMMSRAVGAPDRMRSVSYVLNAMCYPSPERPMRSENEH